MSLRAWFCLAISFLMQTCFHPVFAETGNSAPAATDWKITKTEWSIQDEKNFQEFVFRLGDAIESRTCRTVTECLNSPANTYRKSDPPGLTYRSDCADFPYFLRGYFAWKNGLPFSFGSKMDYRDIPGNSDRDIRYSRYGNYVVERNSVVTPPGTFKDALRFFNRSIPGQISSATLRTHYADSMTDFYPVQISRESIQIGTVLYDPNGHVALVFRVAADGKVSYIDAHPDNSVSSGSYGNKFVRSHPGQGAGFKNWRPQKLIGAQLMPAGYYVGGEISLTPNEELPLFSIEQFFGNTGVSLVDEQWGQGRFQKDGDILPYFDFVRKSLALGDYKIHPVPEFRHLLADLCSAMVDRVQAVDMAIRAELDQKPHPPRLPENIYGTQGEWEEFSTPSRDAQIKVMFNDLVLQAAGFVQKWKDQDPNLIYPGVNLPRELLDVYAQDAMACQVTYVNSEGLSQRLNLEEIRLRLFQLSFDPYHCVERRWGALNPSELQSCREDENKRLWYEREQRLRNQHIRQYDARMDFSLEDLLLPLPGNGTETPPDVDILGFLQAQMP